MECLLWVQIIYLCLYAISWHVGLCCHTKKVNDYCGIFWFSFQMLSDGNVAYVVRCFQKKPSWLHTEWGHMDYVRIAASCVASTCGRKQRWANTRICVTTRGVKTSTVNLYWRAALLTLPRTSPAWPGLVEMMCTLLYRQFLLVEIQLDTQWTTRSGLRMIVWGGYRIVRKRLHERVGWRRGAALARVHTRVLSVGNGLHWQVTWRDTWELTLVSVRTRVLSVGKGLQGQVAWGGTWGLTLASVRTRVLSVGKGLHRQVTWRYTWGLTLASVRTRVLSVGKGLHRQVTWRDTWGLTLASVRTRVLSVGKGLHWQVTWRDTWGLTLASVRTRVLSVGKGLHGQVTWRDTWGLTLASVRTRLLSAGKGL